MLCLTFHNAYNSETFCDNIFVFKNQARHLEATWKTLPRRENPWSFLEISFYFQELDWSLRYKKSLFDTAAENICSKTEFSPQVPKKTETVPKFFFVFLSERSPNYLQGNSDNAAKQFLPKVWTFFAQNPIVLKKL